MQYYELSFKKNLIYICYIGTAKIMFDLLWRQTRVDCDKIFDGIYF